MIKKTIQIPDHLYRKVVAAFGDGAFDAFAVTALGEWVSWLAAEERPMSIPELETNRIFMLYSRLFRGVLPTAKDIGKRFNLPVGRSR